jgi:hypothetical protein
MKPRGRAEQRAGANVEDPTRMKPRGRAEQRAGAAGGFVRVGSVERSCGDRAMGIETILAVDSRRRLRRTA